jgi:ParB family transcriptional regulator, chromosome partitioning protein
MPKASRDALNAKGKFDVPLFDPNDVVLVEDKQSVLYDERVDNDFKESLVLNMMYAPDGEVPQGVLKVCLGRRNPETGKVEIIDGRQRTKAAREANKRLKKQGIEPIRLPVHLRRSNDSRLMAALISSNEHATEDSPMNKARKAQRYIEQGHDEGEVSVLLGVSTSTVKNLLRLLDAPAVVRNAVDAGKITASDGYKLSREEPAEAKKKLDKLLEHAPRTPGKKRSPNARKAREVMGRPEPKAPTGGGGGAPSEPSARGIKKIEDATAEAIAAWIHENWCSDENWDGSPGAIPDRIRAGEWRNKSAAE